MKKISEIHLLKESLMIHVDVNDNAVANGQDINVTPT